MLAHQQLQVIMLKFKVEWIDEHDAHQWDDDPEKLCIEFAGFFEDGPLLVISKPAHGTEYYTFYIFDSIETYLEHLDHYIDRLEGVRWVALIRNNKSERHNALAALQWLGEQVTGHSTTSPTPQSKAHESMDMNVLPGPFQNTIPIKLNLTGWHIDYVLKSFPALSAHMTIPFPRSSEGVSGQHP